MAKGCDEKFIENYRVNGWLVSDELGGDYLGFEGDGVQYGCGDDHLGFLGFRISW